MTRPNPTFSDAALAKAAARRAREAAALRENLRKRKAQARARQEQPPSTAAAQPRRGDQPAEA